MIVVHLTEPERELIRSALYVRSGGFQARYRRFHEALQPDGLLPLSEDDLHWIWRQASRPKKGGWQARTRKIFWRSLCDLFGTFGLKAEATSVTRRSTTSKSGRGIGAHVAQDREVDD